MHGALQECKSPCTAAAARHATTGLTNCSFHQSLIIFFQTSALLIANRLSVHCASQEGLASQADRLEQLQQRGRQLQDPWAAAHTQDDQNLRSQRHLVVAAEEEVCDLSCIFCLCSCLTILDPMHACKEGISVNISKAKLAMENKLSIGGELGTPNTNLGLFIS